MLITHDLHLVRRFADRAAVMEQGMLVEQGPVAQLFEHPQHPYTHKLLHSQPAALHEKRLDGHGFPRRCRPA